MNTKDKWVTTVTIMDPARVLRWCEIFPGAKMPIKSLTPVETNVPELGKTLCYMLDLDAISDKQREGVIEILSKRFNVPVEETRAELAMGVPIPVENTIATTSSWDDVPEELLGEYPPPDRNPKCQCKGNPMAQMFCMFGHMTECHYPQTCEEARCSHYQQEAAGDYGFHDEDDL